MGRILALAFVVAAATLATGCATVTGSTVQTVALQAKDQNGEDVTEAKCELNNDKGRWYLTTPGSVLVQRSNEDMKIVCNKTGHETARQNVASEVKAAMFGNAILGGGVGAVIDHVNGSAYEYPTVISLNMRALSKEEIAALAEKAAQKPAAAVPVQAVARGPAAPSLVPLAIATGRKPLAGDEWEYLAQDNLFGKQKRLIWRVKNVETSGIREELLVDGIPTAQWLFDGQPLMIGLPIDAGLMLGQHWQGSLPGSMRVSGTGACVARYNCVVDTKIWGPERITVAAGTFDAIRVDGSVTMTVPPMTIGTVRFWYSEKDRRLLKQNFQVNSPSMRMNETLELQVARTYQ